MPRAARSKWQQRVSTQAHPGGSLNSTCVSICPPGTFTVGVSEGILACRAGGGAQPQEQPVDRRCRRPSRPSAVPGPLSSWHWAVGGGRRGRRGSVGLTEMRSDALAGRAPRVCGGRGRHPGLGPTRSCSCRRHPRKRREQMAQVPREAAASPLALRGEASRSSTQAAGPLGSRSGARLQLLASSSRPRALVLGFLVPVPWLQGKRLVNCQIRGSTAS